MSTIAASISPKLVELKTSNLNSTLYGLCQAGAQIIFPKSGGHDLGHVTPQLLAYDRTYLQTHLSY